MEMSSVMHRDDGFALVAVIGVIAIVTVVAVAGFAVSQQVLAESERVTDESRAFQVAQSGLDRELATFDKANLTSGHFERTGSTPDGVYTITVDSVGGFEYLITSVGTTIDGRVESVTQRFYYLDLWDMNIGAGQSSPMGGGRGFNGNATIEGPLYIRGTLDLSNANTVYEGGPLFVKDGDLLVGGSATLGDASPIDLFLTGTIGGNRPQNCYYKSLSTSVPDIELPWIDDDYLDRMYQQAIDESTDNYMGYESRGIAAMEAVGGDPTTYTFYDADNDGVAEITRVRAPASPAPSSTHYKYIGASGGRSALNSGNYFLDIDTDPFGAWDGNGYPLGSGLHDDFAYNPAADFDQNGTIDGGLLYVEGTVFIDGDLHLGQNVQAYAGNGTLVVNGDVFIGGDIEPVGTGEISAENCLGIAATGDVTIGDNAHSGNVRARLEGAVFANGEVALYHTQSSFEGSILCDTLYGDKPDIHIKTNPDLPQFIPSSMPALGGMVFPGTWTRN